MTDLSFHPKVLASALENAVIFSTDKAGLSVNDTIRISFDEQGLRFMGRGRYSCSCQSLEPLNEVDEYPTFELFLGLDEAGDAAKALRGMDGAGRKDTTVDLAVLGEGVVAVLAGPEAVVTFEDVEHADELRSTEEFEGIYEVIDKALALPPHPSPTSPVVFTRGVLAKLGKVKLGPPLHDADRWEAYHLGGATWAIAMQAEGTHFTALMESARDGLE